MANTRAAGIELRFKAEMEKVLRRLGISMYEALSFLQQDAFVADELPIYPAEAAKPDMTVEEARAEFLALIEEGRQSRLTEGFYTLAESKALMGL